MQVAKFQSGGFVAHRVHLHGLESRFSLWASDCGKLLDAERIDAMGRAYNVKRGGPTWVALQGKAMQVAARAIA